MPFLLRTSLSIVLLCMSSLVMAIAELDYTPGQAKTAIEVIENLSTKHYRKQPLNDMLSGKLLYQLIDNLDPTKSYFLQADIDEFEQWEVRLDDMFKEGDLSAGFHIYNRYNQRAMARLLANIRLLEGVFQFDLAKDEYLPLDVDSNQWPATNSDSGDDWRKRIKEAYLRLILNDKEPEAAREFLIKRYTNLIKQLTQRDSEDVFHVVMNSLTSLYDPHTSYMSPRSMKNFRIAMSLSLTGIGAVLQLEDEHTKIVRVVSGGPADKQGVLQAGDKIIAVGQGDQEKVDVIGWRLDDVVDLIRGPKESIVRLELIPAKGESAGSSRDILIVR
ncbi:MAG: carboxyl-terminal processing protease, partial [Porticoccus sp.]